MLISVNSGSVHKTFILRKIEGQAIRADMRMGVRKRQGDGAVTVARLEVR